MKYLLSGATICTAEKTFTSDLLVENGIIVAISPMLSADSDTVIIHLNNYHLFPGFVDVHVHLREPGFSYKETIKSGTMSAARGGYTTVCTMPNLNPAPDTLENLAIQQKAIAQQAAVHVHPYGTITKGELGQELADLDNLAPHVVSFSDDGKGVQNDGMMRAAMEKAKKLNRIITAHCEDETLLHGGYIHDGLYAQAQGHKGICSESEWKQVSRDLDLVRKTGCKYHICHVSTKESVDLIRKAKKEGVDVTCETAPHYLILTDDDLQEHGRFKMNPPIRSKADQLALLEGLKDGIIDMIATDHAPHSQEEKSKGLQGSMMGVVGLETAFPVLYTNLVETNWCTLEELMCWLHKNPMERFCVGSPLEVGKPADFTVFDLNREYTIDPAQFQTLGRSTPFEGMQVRGICKCTFVNGKIVWEE